MTCFDEMTDREKTGIVRKIKGLLNLSKSPNVNEAASAAAKAQEMLLKYKIEMADVSVSEQEQAKKDDPLVNEWKTMGKKAVAWKLSLASAVAEGFMCRIVYQPASRWSSHGAEVNFIGRKSSVEVAHYTFAYLGNEIDRLCDLAVEYERDIKGRFMDNGGWKTWRNDFRLGAVHALRTRLKESEQRVVQESRAPDKSRALVLASRGEVEAYYKQLYPRTRSGGWSSRGLQHGDAYSQGKTAGGKIELRRGLSGNGSGPKQIGG